MKRIGILTSGGDAPGMNAAIRAVVRSGVANGLQVIGIRQGYAGILPRSFVRLEPRSVANIIQRGGTFLGTSRYPEMLKTAVRKKVIAVLKEEGIDALVALGGDGTFRGATVLAREGGIKVVGIPTTIDNDVYGTDYTIGFDTAVNTALDAIDKIRDTATSLERLYFIEVMGRTRGFIALHVGLAGGADAICIPETETNIDEMCGLLKYRFSRGKKSGLIVVAEGDMPGGAIELARRVSGCLKEDYRVCVLGHVQRGGAPTARDRVLAGRLGAAAVEALMHGNDGFMVGERGGQVVLTPMESTWKNTKELDPSLVSLVDVLSR
jgi:6-phosphofructokinase 1